MMKITIITQAYNTKNYIKQCICSVLNQTYTEFQYIIIDNGCNDGSEKIIAQLAESDDRIQIIKYEKNIPQTLWLDMADRILGEYFVILDADDWIEPTFLEKLVSLAEKNDIDIVSTGTCMHEEGYDQEHYRNIQNRMIINSYDFPDSLIHYHAFFRTVWAKLIKTSIFKNTSYENLKASDVSYGIDTLITFAWLRNSKRICLDNSVLHHYRIHKKSVSHQYDPRQSYSDIYLYNDALNFLSQYGDISVQNRFFLDHVYCNAINDTVKNINSSTLPLAEKIHEYNKILMRQVTINAFNWQYPDIIQIRKNLLLNLLEAAEKLSEYNSDLEEIYKSYFPKCRNAISPDNLKLFFNEEKLLNALVNDNPESVLSELLKLISEKKYTKQFDLGNIVNALVKDDPLLGRITDLSFMKNNCEIIMLIFQGKREEALDKITECFSSDHQIDEMLLNLYLSLAAMLDRVNEFIFGKINSALFYFYANEIEKCKSAIAEIDEMGINDVDEINEIKNHLQIK